VVLRSGCICCTIRGDLIDTLGDLDERARRGEIPPFGRVVIETTGLAEPVPIIQAFLEERTISARFALRALVATVDAVTGRDALAQHPEAAKQIAAAGLALLTKTDIADPGEVEAIRDRILAINPMASIQTVVDGKADPAVLLDAPGWEPPAGDAASWLPAGAFGPRDSHGLSHRQGAAGLEPIAAVALTLDKPVSWTALAAWLNALISLRGGDILRLKGLVNVAGRSGPRMLQGVQHLLHPPRDHVQWPDGDRRTRIIVIGRNLPAAGLRRSLEDAIQCEAQG
jgi:G3E family GTPase